MLNILDNPYSNRYQTLQQRIDAILVDFKADGGGHLYFPSGTYYCILNLDDLDNVTISGDGPDTIITVIDYFRGISSSAHGVITIGATTESKNIILKDFVLDGNGTNQNYPTGHPDGYFNALSFRKCNGVELRDLHLKNGALDTVYIAGISSVSHDCLNIKGYNLTIDGSLRRALSFVESAKNLQFNLCKINGNSNGSAMGIESGSDELACQNIILNNSIIDGGVHNLSISGSTDIPEDIKIINSIMLNSEDSAIDASKYKRFSILDTTILDPADHGFETGTVMANCVDLDLDIKVINAGGRGVWLRACEGVRGKVDIQGSTSVGLDIGSSTSSNYSNNVDLHVSSKDGDSNGILVSDYATNIYLSLDEVSGNDSDGVMIGYPVNSDFVCQISCGQVYGNTGSGIRTNFPSSYSGSFSVMGIDSHSNSSYGVELDADADYVRLIGNDLRGNTSGSMSGSVGANGVDSGNIK